MTPSRSSVLSCLLRVERALSSLGGAVLEEVRGLLEEVRALPSCPPAARAEPPTPRAPRARRPRPTPPPVLGRPLPPAPRAKPLLSKLLAPSPPPPEARARKEAPPDPIGEKMREAEGARSLLLEVIRRAAYDWVLYRQSRRIDQKQLAEDAYTWIFQEDESHPNWRHRLQEGKELTAFISICRALDLDPERVRGFIRNLTPNKVMSSGRPPENSRASDHSPAIEIHADVPGAGSDTSYDFDALLGPSSEYD